MGWLAYVGWVFQKRDCGLGQAQDDGTWNSEAHFISPRGTAMSGPTRRILQFDLPVPRVDDELADCVNKREARIEQMRFFRVGRKEYMAL